jgi:hypothetical protein
LAQQLTNKDIIDLYIGGFSTSEIGEKLGIDRQLVEYHLASQKSDLSFQMRELTENLAIVSLARLEFIVKKIWPAVTDGDLRAIKELTNVTKLEIEWRDRLVPQRDDPEQITIELEHFEQTMTSSSDHYSVALANLQEDWMRTDEIKMEDVYANESHLPDAGNLTKRINEIEKRVDEIVGDESDEI